MKKFTGLFMAAILASSLLAGCNRMEEVSGAPSDTAAASTAEDPFVLGVSPMTGWYAWYGVDGTGIFEKNGVNVKIEFFPVYSDSLTAFYSGQVDGICIAGSDAVAPLNEGVDFKIVLVNDNSYGADGLVVQDGIESVQDLKGKSVATEVGTLEHMFLLKILEENGMTIDDVNFTNMTINDAGPAFIAGSVDAAVLWEPTLSAAIEAGGNLLYSTKEEPGLIPDTLAVRQEVLDERGEDVQKIVDSWFEGVEKLDARDEAFIEAICQGAELEKEDYITMLDGVTVFDKAENQETFKRGEDYTYLNYTLEKSAEFLLDTKMIDKLPEDVTVILDDTYIK
ncbi:ABC transporter substrate-binding protein [Murimonas intestini]|uniref:NitT/TauT family transport system substrate-binding protein n=1 Tax=Murimonas intestini TaxID=1337051 RepID=A0AB73T2K8_9FIRM|nr:ABC transporter substrate-binding protein [Murimonas intestini]MCR1842672.1 ABC transporter substrate-binding protein [Murimonas intestini]MCR1867281.1 ABC transporter substrate-binding protein [Murimonas intestini]MCR1884467.1 ABC transporter substrate-binding protein [Murimonas intestini]